MANATVQGVDRLKAKLAAIPESVRQAMSSAIEKNAEELVGMMKRLVPVDTGELRDSIRWDWIGGDENFGSEGLREGRATQIMTKGNAQLAAVVTAGSKEAYHARFVEFGTRPGRRGGRAIYQAGTGGSGLSLNSTESGGKIRSRKVYRTHPGTPAQPFFFVSYRALKKRMVARLSAATRKAIKALKASV
jgi:HK97 gp10 family phage protein